MEFIDKVAWVHVADRRLLSARSRGKDAYYLPGGKREPGETDEQCLAREISEELAVRIDPASLAYLGQFEAQAHGKPEGVVVRLRCYAGGYAGARVARRLPAAWVRYAVIVIGFGLSAFYFARQYGWASG